MKKSEKLKFRVAPPLKRRVQLAAEVEQLSVAEWVRQTLSREARRTLDDRIGTIVSMGPADASHTVHVVHVEAGGQTVPATATRLDCNFGHRRVEDTVP